MLAVFECWLGVELVCSRVCRMCWMGSGTREGEPHGGAPAQDAWLLLRRTLSSDVPLALRYVFFLPVLLLKHSNLLPSLFSSLRPRSAGRKIAPPSQTVPTRPLSLWPRCSLQRARIRVVSPRYCLLSNARIATNQCPLLSWGTMSVSRPRPSLRAQNHPSRPPLLPLCRANTRTSSQTVQQHHKAPVDL